MTKICKLTIIRGLPGSGKSTEAKRICALTGAKHVESDMFFMIDGAYLYIPEKIAEAHAWCLQQVRSLLAAGNDVVVSNTFTQKWEMAPYLELGVPTEVVEMKSQYENVHGVNAATLERMRLGWEELT
jgi:predicted kinase